MQVEHLVCGGIDVHKDTLTACLRRVDANGQVSKEGREFATTSTSLLALSDWLVEQHCPVVAMESTGVYWQPVSHVLAGTVEVCIGNAHERCSRPGKKTDKRDAAWIAELLAHGLIRPSVVPPPEMCALRDVTRTRVALVHTRSQSKNRVHTLLEDTNLTLGSVVSDLFGVTGRRRLAALVAGARDPQV
jgi:transposase